MFKKIIKLYLLIFVVMVLLLPAVADAEEDKLKYCWSQQACQKDGGEWEVDTEKCKEGFDKNPTGNCYDKIDIAIDLQVPIPALQGGADTRSVKSFPIYLKIIYTFFVSVVGIIAVAYIAFGGYQWMAAAGSPEKINQAKDTIKGAVLGMLLAVGSYFLLNQINSNLVKFKPLRLPKIKPAALMSFCDQLPGNTTVYLKADKEKSAPAKIADCGDEYFVEGMDEDITCIGKLCNPDVEVINGVSYPISCLYVPEESKNDTGYTCFKPKDACGKITDGDVVREIAKGFGTQEESGDTWDSTCNKYSIEGQGECLWRETWAVHIYDGCVWYTQEDKNNYCKKKGEIEKCDDYNALIVVKGGRYASGDDYVACVNNWCNSDLNCSAEWVWNQVWDCQ